MEFAAGHPGLREAIVMAEKSAAVSNAMGTAAQNVTDQIAVQASKLPVVGPIIQKSRSGQEKVKIPVDARRRIGVSAETNADTNSSGGKFVNPTHEKSYEAKGLINDAIKGNTLFASLAAAQMAMVVDAMTPLDAVVGQAVIIEGDTGDYFYVVESGEYEVFLKKAGDKAVHTYKNGSAFGELALMYNTPRSATVRCTVPGRLFALERNVFRGILMSVHKEESLGVTGFLKSISLLAALTDEQREAVAEVLEEITFKDGDLIVKQGDPADALWLIKEGECDAYKVAYIEDEDSDSEDEENVKLAQTKEKAAEAAKQQGGKFRMKAPAVFGESALSGKDDAKRMANVVAVGTPTLYKLTRENFKDLLGEDLAELAQRNFNEKVLGGMDMFKTLEESERAKLIEALTEETFEAGEDIIRQGEEGQDFYIIVSGTVKVTRYDEIKDETLVIKDGMTTGAYFGEMAILEDKPRMATVTANNKVVCMALDRFTFDNILGPMKELMEREKDRRQREIERKQKKNAFTLDNFEVRTILGVGTFGRVKLVVDKRTGLPYALKCLRKGQVIALKQTEHVMNEKELLERCDHPMLLRLVASFQDEHELYMLLELALGGELFSRLREQEKFDYDTACFYAANVAAAFTYLHDRKVVYRDLKPENLMFGIDGYLKVVDFGFAKVIKDKTFTLCGTPEYLAPEIITNKGHGLAVDWWAVGILLYEMLVGEAPFSADDPMTIYDMILNNTPQFSYWFDSNAKDLIMKLLVHSPSRRLGSLRRGSRDILLHDFFKEIEWSYLNVKRTPAPYIPLLDHPEDVGNFDQYDEEDVDKYSEHLQKQPDAFSNWS